MIGIPKMKRISTPDTYKVIKLLEVYFVVSEDKDEDGTAIGEYRPGWSDSTIAAKTGRNVHATHVQRIRQQMFGHILNVVARRRIAKTQQDKFSQSTFANMPEIDANVVKLRNKVEWLQNMLTKLQRDRSEDDVAFDDFAKRLDEADNRFNTLTNNVAERLDKLEFTLSKLLSDLGVAEEVAAHSESEEEEEGEDKFSAINP